jgi:phosphate transport system substrate-binding protein
VAAATIAVGAAASCSASRTQIRIVGSSTVFPFTAAVAENFHRLNPGLPSPIVESTGTAAGIRLFCAGIGSAHPDVVDASRRMQPAERAGCTANGVGAVVEIAIGIDGVVLIQGRNGRPLALAMRDIYAGLAATPFGRPQAARTWRDVNPAFPALAIEVIGPPPTSGTRGAFNSLFLKAGCRSEASMRALEQTDPRRFEQLCTRIREDGAWVEGGENDNLVVQKLVRNPQAIGVLGYSFLQSNRDRVRAITVAGVPASDATIADGRYPASRPLYLYVKKQHVGAIRGLDRFLAEYVSERSIGPGGYLQRRGLVPLPASARRAARDHVHDLVARDAADRRP